MENIVDKIIHKQKANSQEKRKITIINDDQSKQTINPQIENLSTIPISQKKLDPKITPKSISPENLLNKNVSFLKQKYSDKSDALNSFLLHQMNVKLNKIQKNEPKSEQKVKKPKYKFGSKRKIPNKPKILKNRNKQQKIYLQKTELIEYVLINSKNKILSEQEQRENEGKTTSKKENIPIEEAKLKKFNRVKSKIQAIVALVNKRLQVQTENKFLQKNLIKLMTHHNQVNKQLEIISQENISLREVYYNLSSKIFAQQKRKIAQEEQRSHINEQLAQKTAILKKQNLDLQISYKAALKQKAFQQHEKSKLRNESEKNEQKLKILKSKNEEQKLRIETKRNQATNLERDLLRIQFDKNRVQLMEFEFKRKPFLGIFLRKFSDFRSKKT